MYSGNKWVLAQFLNLYNNDNVHTFPHAVHMLCHFKDAVIPGIHQTDSGMFIYENQELGWKSSSVHHWNFTHTGVVFSSRKVTPISMLLICKQGGERMFQFTPNWLSVQEQAGLSQIYSFY